MENMSENDMGADLIVGRIRLQLSGLGLGFLGAGREFEVGLGCGV